MKTKTYEKYIAKFDISLQDNNYERALGHLITGLVAEVGEVAQLYQRVTKGGESLDTLINTRHLSSELGDVLWYLTRIAAMYGLRLDTIMQHNMQKLRERNLEDAKQKIQDSPAYSEQGYFGDETVGKFKTRIQNCAKDFETNFNTEEQEVFLDAANSPAQYKDRVAEHLSELAVDNDTAKKEGREDIEL